METTLIGTEKQIAWVTEIRNTKLPKMAKAIARLQEEIKSLREDGENDEADELAEELSRMEKYYQTFSTMESASDWISLKDVNINNLMAIQKHFHNKVNPSQ